MNGKHILICDDEKDFLGFLSIALEGKGYIVSKALDGKSATEIILRAENKDTPIELLVTDLYMPEMNGLELIRRIRDLGFCFPVIVITGYGNREILKELIKIGCDDFWTNLLIWMSYTKRSQRFLKNRDLLKGLMKKHMKTFLKTQRFVT